MLGQHAQLAFDFGIQHDLPGNSHHSSVLSRCSTTRRTNSSTSGPSHQRQPAWLLGSCFGTLPRRWLPATSGLAQAFMSSEDWLTAAGLPNFGMPA
jgi:hypothetical protein